MDLKLQTVTQPPTEQLSSLDVTDDGAEAAAERVDRGQAGSWALVNPFSEPIWPSDGA